MNALRQGKIKATSGVVVLLAAGLLAAGAFGGVSPLGLTSSGGTSASSAGSVASSPTAASNYLLTLFQGTSSSTDGGSLIPGPIPITRGSTPATARAMSVGHPISGRSMCGVRKLHSLRALPRTSLAFPSNACAW